MNGSLVSRFNGAEEIFQNLLNTEGLVTLFDPSKSSMYATPPLSPVAAFDIEFGLGSTCAISPSKVNRDNFSALNMSNLLIEADRLSKSFS